MAEPTALTLEEAQTKVESLALRLVLLSPDDLPGLAAVHSVFEDLVSAPAGVLPPVVMEAARHAAAKTAEIILGDEPDSAAVVQLLGETVGCMQQLIKDGRRPDEVRFPVGLGMRQAELGNDGGSVNGGQTDTAMAELLQREADALAGDFVNEAQEHLDRVENLFVALGESVATHDMIYAAIGAFHSIKGASALIGLNDISTVAHAAEALLERIGRSEQRVNTSTREAILATVDLLRQMERHVVGGDAVQPNLISAVLARLEHAKTEIGQGGETRASTPAPAPAPEVTDPVAALVTDMDAASTEVPALAATVDHELLGDFINESLEHLQAAENHLLDVEPGRNIVEPLNAIFRAFHTIKGVAGFLNLSDIRNLAHEAETLLDLARTGKVLPFGDTRQLVFDTIDLLRHLVYKCGGCATEGGPVPDYAKLLQGIRVAAGHRDVDPPVAAPAKPAVIAPSSPRPLPAASPVSVEPAAASVATTPAAPVPPSSVADTDAPESAEPSPTPDAPQATAATKAIHIKETLRLDAERVDRLVDAIGELVIAQVMVEQAVDSSGATSQQLLRNLSNLGKITRELQAMGTALRMVSVKPMFQKMARLVHDLAKKVDKKVNLVLAGEETELDKTVVEQIGDPLVHMLRNAVDHGLEDDPAVRRAAGKPEAGRVELRAFQKGGNIYIEVEDDGRGMNQERILAKARQLGLVKDGVVLSEAEIFSLVMLPGFSTASKVTEVSGRGVGMDVVKRNIESLRGQVEIRSTLGKGTTFSVRLPLTLAIIDGLVIRSGGERYILPTLAVVRTVKPAADEISGVLGKGAVLQDSGNLLPLYRLTDLLGCPPDANAKALAEINGLVMIIESAGKRFGIYVDELVGKQQIVIKPLGEMLKNIPAVSGGAIMPDGNVALILDVEGLLDLAMKKA